MVYGELRREDFDAVVRFVATAEGEERVNAAAKLLLDREGNLHPLRKSAAGLYAQNVGTIAQEGQVNVRVKEGAVIGQIEEAFAQVLKANDRFLLGGRCVQFWARRG